jgi:hypothetical protein
MPIAGLGLHILIALFFAVHVVRTGQQNYWLFVLFSFPLLGSIVYFVAIYLPDSRLERGARNAMRSAAKALDPTRGLREAQANFDYQPTAQNQMRLAEALLEADVAGEAAKHFEACLKGPFAANLDIRFGAARSHFASSQQALAVSHLDAIRAADNDFRADQVALLRARALSGAGRDADARAEFESALNRFGSFECRVEYAIWALARGEQGLAANLQTQIDRSMERWNRHTRELNKPLLRRLNIAHSLAAHRSS